MGNSFTKYFKENVPDTDADAILLQFCREYIDEIKSPSDNLPRRHLPFQLTELLDNYLCCECEKNQMPHMLWHVIFWETVTTRTIQCLHMTSIPFWHLHTRMKNAICKRSILICLWLLLYLFPATILLYYIKTEKSFYKKSFITFM